MRLERSSMSDQLAEREYAEEEEAAGTARPTCDLPERAALFWEAIVAFAKRVPHNDVSIPLIRQIVRSGTSVGANYGEADDAVSKREFRHRIGVSKKESRETKYSLRMIVS